MREDPLAGPLPVAGRPPPGALPPRRCAATGSGSARKGPGGEGGSRPRPRALQRPLPDLAASRGRGPSARCAFLPPSSPLTPHGAGGRRGPGGRGPPPPARLSTGADCPQCDPDRVASPGRGSARDDRRQGSAAMSANHPTRLETRTKESNARASQRVSAKPRGAMKVRAGARPRWDPGPRASKRRGLRAHHRPVSPAPSGRWSVSARDRTRKMVNYAWAGRSQRKLWWRPAAVLTCKSVVRPGYRGERLIEPSSSWFPSKSPSGRQALRVSQFYLVKRMIRGLGAETISTYSQTLNG